MDFITYAMNSTITFLMLRQRMASIHVCVDIRRGLMNMRHLKRVS